MQVALILAFVAVATAAPTNNVIEPQFPQGFVATGAVPTTYSAVGSPAVFTAPFQGTFFGGRPGTYVRKYGVETPAAATPVAVPYSAFPQTYSAFPQTYSAFPQTYSAFPQTFSGFPQTFSGFPQTYSGIPAATVYSGAPVAIAASPAFPESVQQNEGARLIKW